MLEDRRYLKIIFLVSVIMLSIIIIPSGIFIGMVKYDKWSANNTIVEARQHRENGDLDLALKKIQALTLQQPNNSDVLRELARTLIEIWEQSKNPKIAEKVISTWNSLKKNREMTSADRREYANAAITLGYIHVAKNIITEAKDKDSIENILLLQRISYIDRDFSDAKTLGEQAHQLQPNNPETKLIYAKSLISTNDPNDNNKAYGILNKLQERNDQTGIMALSLICKTASFSDKSRLIAAEKLQRHPATSIEFHLLSTEIKITLIPEDAAKLLQETIDIFTASSHDDIVIIGRWLNKQNAFRYTLSLIDEFMAFQRQDLFLIRADALAKEEQWVEIERLLNNPKVPLHDFHRRTFLGLAIAAQGRHDEATAIWRAALAPGSNLEYRLHFLARHTSSRKYYKHAERIFNRMILNPKTIKTGYKGLIQIARQQNDPQKTLKILHDMKKSFPNNNAIRNDINYYNLLTDNKIPSHTQSALELYNSDKKMLAFRLTLAVALLKTNDYKQAYNLLDINNMNWINRAPYARLIKAATLMANNQKDKGLELFKTIGSENIMNIEHRVISPYLKK